MSRETPTKTQAETTLQRVRDRLTARFGQPAPWTPSVDAVGTLIATILSQNTSKANSTAGFGQLTRRFGRQWDRIARARVATIERCIRVAGLSNVKAPRIRAILREIRHRHGSIDLEFLGQLPPDEAYDYLVGFDGVGPKTALCVLLFHFAMPVFPVDTHILRIAKRLGVLDGRVDLARAHEHLTELIPPDRRGEMHLLLIRLGRELCKARNPICEDCPLTDLCPSTGG